MELHKNELLQIHITGMTAEGFGVAESTESLFLFP